MLCGAGRTWADPCRQESFIRKHPFHLGPHILAPLSAFPPLSTSALAVLFTSFHCSKISPPPHHDWHSYPTLPQILPTKDWVRPRIFFRFHSFLWLSNIPPDFPGSSVIKNLPASEGDAGDTGLIPGLERSPGGGNGNPPQYSSLENSMDRGAW